MKPSGLAAVGLALLLFLPGAPAFAESVTGPDGKLNAGQDQTTYYPNENNKVVMLVLHTSSGADVAAASARVLDGNYEEALDQYVQTWCQLTRSINWDAYAPGPPTDITLHWGGDASSESLCWAMTAENDDMALANKDSRVAVSGFTPDPDKNEGKWAVCSHQYVYLPADPPVGEEVIQSIAGTLWVSEGLPGTFNGGTPLEPMASSRGYMQLQYGPESSLVCKVESVTATKSNVRMGSYSAKASHVAYAWIRGLSDGT